MGDGRSEDGAVVPTYFEAVDSNVLCRCRAVPL